MSAAIPRAAATCLAVETAAANRRFASASLRACAPPRTPGHRVTDSRRRSELSQLPNVRGAPMVLQEPPAGSPIPSLSRPNGRPFCCPIPSETSVQAGGFFRTFIRILKQGYRLRAYEYSQVAAAAATCGRRRPSRTRISTVAQEQTKVRPSAPRLPNWVSRPTRSGGETAEARLSGNAIIDIALANSV